jgi:hypothetical protein
MLPKAMFAGFVWFYETQFQQSSYFDNDIVDWSTRQFFVPRLYILPTPNTLDKQNLVAIEL